MPLNIDIYNKNYFDFLLLKQKYETSKIILYCQKRNILIM